MGLLQPGVPRAGQEGLAPPPRPCRVALAPRNCPAHQNSRCHSILWGPGKFLFMKANLNERSLFF